MLNCCKVFSCLGYSKGRVIKPYALMYVAKQDYSMVVSNPSRATTGFKLESDDNLDKPGNNWDLSFLKDEFSQFKTLNEKEKQRLWLASHFILRKPETIIERLSTNSETETAAEVENSSEIIGYIVCSDKIRVDAKPFLRESELVQMNMDSEYIIVESNSEIIKKVQLLCEERALIWDDHVNNDNDDLFQLKLNEVNSKFRKENRIYAIDLVIAAINLGIKSLLDLMIEDIDDMFTKMTIDDEAYKILSVNLRGDYPRGNFEFLKRELRWYRWAFDADSHKQGLRTKENINWDPDIENINWDPELLKVSFYQYKTLPYEQRRQWLIAHFLLRQPHVVSSIRFHRTLTEERKRMFRLRYPNVRFFDDD